MTPIISRPGATADGIADAAAAVDRAVGWLLARIDHDGVPGCGAEGTYRLPHTLLLTGNRPLAARVLSWMRRDILTPAGDLRDGPMRTAFGRQWSSYPLAIIAEAAWKMEQFDTASAILRTLRGFQDPGTGGAFAERPELRTTARQDLFPTAQLGITGLITGRVEMADLAARWLGDLWRAQPRLPQLLYTATDGPRLIVEIDDRVDNPTGTAGAVDPLRRFGLVTDLRARRQAFYNPGIAAAFLARYAAARNAPDAGALAADYLDLSANGSQAQFDHRESVQICKFGWGAAALLELTGQQRHREQVLRMIGWFCSAQQPDGHWDNSPFLTQGRPTETSAVEVTAEFVQHLVVMTSALAGRAS